VEHQPFEGCRPLACEESLCRDASKRVKKTCFTAQGVFHTEDPDSAAILQDSGVFTNLQQRAMGSWPFDVRGSALFSART
jgi:hypothetical protein